MSRLVLDSGGVTRLARSHKDTLALITVLRRDGIWPPVVPSVVLVECLTGRQRTDALVNRLLKTCDILDSLPVGLARRAAALRAQANQGSAVDAIVVATAEPAGWVLGGDLQDLAALAAYSEGVRIRRA